MTYGTIKVDTVTFTNDGVDKSVTLSGLVQNPTFSGNVTVTGTLSGVTVTGTTANFTSGNFTNISGGTHTITSGVFAAGSAASPSITFTGDLNTGIYSPGADQVAISTGGSGRLFVDASGRLGVGTSSPSFPIESKVTGLDSTIWGYNVAQFADATANNTGLRIGTNTSTSGLTQLIAATNSAASQFGFWTYNGSAWGERMRLNSSGRLGVGTSSPSVSLEVSGPTASNPEIRVVDGTVNTQWYASNVGECIFGTFSNHPQVFRTNGNERLRITATGNVGIGTTSPGQSLSIVAPSTAQAVGIWNRATDNIYGGIYFKTSDGITDQSSILNERAGTNGASLLLYTKADGGSATERARIDSSGRLLVGTSSASGTNTLFESSSTTANAANVALVKRNSGTADQAGQQLHFYNFGPTGTARAADTEVGSMRFYGSQPTSGAAQEMARITCAADLLQTGTNTSGRLVFSTTADGESSPTERMRIGSTGAINVYSSADGVVSRVSAANGTTTLLFAGLYNATSTITGTISFVVYSNGNIQNTNNSYGAYSDLKLKENIVNANSQWSDIKALQVRNYNFKEGQTHTQIGLIAQEVELVSPGLVTESPDRDAEGNDLGTVTKSVNYSVLYMKAVKALQEAMERIEVLEQRLTDAGIA